MKCKSNKKIIGILLVFVLLCANSNHVFAEEIENIDSEAATCEEHEFDRYETVKEPTIKKMGKRIRCCINCDYYEEYSVPTLPKMLKMHEGQLFIKPNTTKVINFCYLSR